MPAASGWCTITSATSVMVKTKTRSKNSSRFETRSGANEWACEGMLWEALYNRQHDLPRGRSRPTGDGRRGIETVDRRGIRADANRGAALRQRETDCPIDAAS